MSVRLASRIVQWSINTWLLWYTSIPYILAFRIRISLTIIFDEFSMYTPYWLRVTGPRRMMFF